MTNNAIGLLETTYSRVSFRPHNHYDCCTNLAENSPSEFEYTVLQNIMTWNSWQRVCKRVCIL